MSRGLLRLRKIGVIGLTVTLSFSGPLTAGQAIPTASTSTQKTLLQQLTDLLQPLNILVTPSAGSISEAFGTREFRVRWTAGTAAFPADVPKPGPPPIGSFQLLQERTYPDPPPRQRSLDLTAGRLFIAAVDRINRLRAWTTVIDPRIVRSEGPGAAGKLTGQTLHFDETEFFVSIHNDPEIVEVRIYESHRDGQSHRLALLGWLSPGR